MNLRKYRSTWLRLHKGYEKKAYTVFIRSLRDSANRVPWEQLDKGNYQMLIEFNINDVEIQKAFFDIYFTIGSLHGKRVGNGINKESKAFLPDSFIEAYRDFIKMFVGDSLGLKITSVRQSMVGYLIEEIQKGITEGKDIREIARNMQKLINSRNFYRWQALRIARTETTAAANYGAIKAGESSGVGLDKVWISAMDSRTRRRPDDKYDHWELNGVKVPSNGLFQDGNAFLRFPGDTKAPAGAVINCRCTTALVPKRDENGDLVFI